MQYTHVNTDSKIVDFRRRLHHKNVQVVAMDFEGEYNLHHYGEKLCLVQVFDGDEFYIIDPFEISPNEIRKTLESHITKLFYGASSDAGLVFRQYFAQLRAVLDLEIVASVMQVSLGGLDTALFKVLGVEIKNKKKYQRYDWTIRPIPENAIEYALGDVKYLFDLKNRLFESIRQKNLVESMAYRTARTYNEQAKQQKPRIKSNAEYKSRTLNEKKVFDTVVHAREAVAREIDKPPNNVVSNAQLFDLLKKKILPNELKFGKGISRSTKDKLVETFEANLKTLCAPNSK